MAKTLEDAVNEARAILQDRDSAAYRYSTADLVEYYDNAVRELRRLRPDSFFGTYLVNDLPDSDPNSLAVPLVFDETFFPAVVFYMAGTAELRDDEFTVDGRAVTLHQQFVAKVRTAEA